MKRLVYIIPLLLLAFVSCRDFHVSLVGDSVVAEVDDKQLYQSDLVAAIPKEYKGDDSISFAEVFIDKWIRKQIKLREAERVFINAERDIELMVEDYRQSLLMRRLDERCVSSSVDTTYTEHEISQYYQDHAKSFRLNRDILKGEVLRIPLDNDQSKKIKGLMTSAAESKREDMLSICEKNNFEFTDLSLAWVEASELLDLLPLVRREEPDKLLSTRGLQHAKDDSFDYYYQIIDHKQAGDIAPLEWVRSTIRTILITERQQQLIRDNEELLYARARAEGIVKQPGEQTEN